MDFEIRISGLPELFDPTTLFGLLVSTMKWIELLV